jgi:hypothetical protein
MYPRRLSFVDREWLSSITSFETPRLKRFMFGASVSKIQTQLGQCYRPYSDNIIKNTTLYHFISKAVALHAMEAHGGERRYSSYSYLTSTLDGGEWLALRLGRA